MEPLSRTVERVAGQIAAASHGVVTRAGLLGAGVTRAEIKRRLRSGALLREFPGVYRVGHRAPSVEARYLAAVLACGEGALLSGRAAAHLLGILKGPPPPPEVTAPERRVKGIRNQRARPPALQRTPRPGAASRLQRCPARSSSWRPCCRTTSWPACHEAGVRHGTTPAQVEAVLARRPRSAGASMLRAVLRGEFRVTLSKLEKRFLSVLRRAGLPLPRTNRPAGGRRVDCRWPELHLTVELDSYRYHHSRHAWEQDRRREREAYARGDEFRRYTYRDVLGGPELMLAELRGLLRGDAPRREM
jgi:hypothetical protein